MPQNTNLKRSPYFSPNVKVIELIARNAILESSPGSTLEGGNTPLTPGW